MLEMPKPPENPWLVDGRTYWALGQDQINDYFSQKEKFLEELSTWERQNGLVDG